MRRWIVGAVTAALVLLGGAQVPGHHYHHYQPGPRIAADMYAPQDMYRPQGTYGAQDMYSAQDMY
jgi:hypothetical protein